MFRKCSGFVVGVGAVVIATVIICVCAFSCAGGNMAFNASYYFVCYRVTDNVISAGSLSGTDSSYGGAGYNLSYDGNYYVIMSCYYQKNDAETVCSSLKKRDLDCTVLEIKTDEYRLKSYSAKRNEELYLGNLNTLHTLSMLAYECANGLDTGSYTQQQAKSVAYDIKSGLKGLLSANSGNCFMHGLNTVLNCCEEREKGYIYSKDMRYMQAAVIDLIVNVKLN